MILANSDPLSRYYFKACLFLRIKFKAIQYIILRKHIHIPGNCTNVDDETCAKNWQHNIQNGLCVV